MWGKNGLKWKFSLQTISGLTCKERERSHPERDQTQSPEPFNLAPFDFAVRLRLRIAPRSHPSTSLANPEARIARLRLRLLRMPSTSPRSHPRIARLRLCRLRTLGLRRLRTPSTSLRWHRDGTDRIEIAIEKWLGFDEFDRICVYVLRNGIIYLFGSWENMRKCEEQKENVFSILFSATQPNTWKYFPFLKIAFPENIYFSKNILHWTKQNLSHI